MPSGYGPSRGKTTPGWVTMTVSAAGKTCIYPGCERPAVPPHPLGGPQPAFCDLEEHNALTAHQERQRLGTTRRREPMADEAYRAVFLRVHPTGKMVLSLTTEADGKEPDYAQLVGERARRPALDVKVVPADTDRWGGGGEFGMILVSRDHDDEDPVASERHELDAVEDRLGVGGCNREANVSRNFGQHVRGTR